MKPRHSSFILPTETLGHEADARGNHGGYKLCVREADWLEFAADNKLRNQAAAVMSAKLHFRTKSNPKGNLLLDLGLVGLNITPMLEKYSFQKKGAKMGTCPA